MKNEYILVSIETLKDIKERVNTLAGLSLKAERYDLGREIKQSIADLMALKQVVTSKHKPITESEIYSILNAYYRLPGPVEFTRAIESYHGIKGE